MTDVIQLTRDIIAYQLAKTSLENEKSIVSTTRELREGLEVLYKTFDVQSYPAPKIQHSEKYGLLFQGKKGFTSRKLYVLSKKELEDIMLCVVNPDPFDRESCYELMTMKKDVIVRDWQERKFLCEVAREKKVHGADWKASCYEHKHQVKKGYDGGLQVVKVNLSAHLRVYWNINEKDSKQLKSVKDVYQVFETYQRKRGQELYEDIDFAKKVLSSKKEV